MNANAFLERALRAIQKRKKRDLPGYAAEKIRFVARKKWRALFNDKNHVFVFEAEPPVVTLADGMRVESYTAVDEIPKTALNKMIEESGATTTEWLNKEFSEKSVLWLLFVEGEFVVRQFTRHGRFYDKWFYPLKDDDFVFLAASTFPEFRGRGLSPLLKRYIMAQQMRSGGRAFVDCKVWNKSAIRALEKNDFRHIGIMRNYWEGDSVRERVSAALKKLAK